MATKPFVRVMSAILCSVALFGCAEERDPVDRTQPFALEKSLFVGEDLVGTEDDPEFWTQATLIDVGYGAKQSGLFTSTYAQPVSRIKWQITESLLIGRIAYERIEDTDGKGLGGPVQDGVISVAFNIKSHFDIQNIYNPTTGEQVNIVEENTRDRPWYERKYFRVDWSKNLNVDSYDFDTLSLVGLYGGVKYEPLKYDVTDPNDPDAPVFELENGYMDVTNKAFAKPQQIDLSFLGWGIASFPACFLDPDFLGGSGPAGTCSPAELTIRHSFRRVEDTDYEPIHWDGIRFSAYGSFDLERQGFTRNYGMTDAQWRRFATRYNIWKRSHFYDNPDEMTGAIECYTPDSTGYGQDPLRDEDGNGTHDECEAAGAGSRCDIFKQRCTLPFQERDTRPIVWHFTVGSDSDYFDATRRATNDWDAAMRAAVRTIKYAECKRVGKEGCDTQFPVYHGQQDMNEDLVNLLWEINECKAGVGSKSLFDAGDCDSLADSVGQSRGYDAALIDIAKAKPMVVLCHSPVEFSDDSLCGDKRLPPNVSSFDCFEAARDSDLKAQCDAALNVRMGDLRFHQVNVIEAPQTPSPWGIYTDSEDPLTGETISASINVWSYVNDLFSQKVIDQVRYIKGELSTEDITEADYVDNFAAAAEQASYKGVIPTLTAEAKRKRLADFAHIDVEHIELDPKAAKAKTPLPAEVLKQAMDLKYELKHTAFSWNAPSANRAIYSARANQARGSEFEAKLMTPMMQQFFGVEGMPINGSVLDRVSPLRGGNPSVERELRHWKENALAERGSCVLHEAPAPLAMTGLANILEEKFGDFDPEQDGAAQYERAEKMRKYVASRAHYAVIVHEMGHSIGMRHNFVSSSDAYNYRPQYWQLRTKDGTVTDLCAGLGDGEDCVGPRYFDPMTEGEHDNMLWMFMHSSVMDYAGEATQDFLGLGAYDFAAPKMFYGDTVAVYQNESYGLGETRGNGVLGKIDTFGGILGFSWDIGDETHHYSELQNIYELIKDCKEVNPNDYRPASWDEEIDGVWHPVLDGRIVEVNGKYTRCSQQEVDYSTWEELRLPEGSEIVNGFRGGPAIDKDNRLRVPYGFGTDSWADLGNLSVYRHDNGADAYELFDFFITQQEVGHIFDNYRRGRTTFSIRRAAGRQLGRYNEKMRDGAKGLGLLKNIYETFGLNLGYAFDGYWPFLSGLFFEEQVLAAGFAFDHFTRQLARPEHGPHYRDPLNQNILRSDRDSTINGTINVIDIPNGATGHFGDIGIGGRPVENQLADDKGEYDNQYTINAGSYYEKMYTSMLLTESVDNFISSSRTDFTDPRYRSVSMADLFPDGYRRWLGNNLTNDDFIKGVRITQNERGRIKATRDNFPRDPLGWTSWWGSEPRSCFPADGTTICGRYNLEEDESYGSEAPANVAVIDPQVKWEQQKFLIAWTMMYLPSNQQQDWIDMMRIWELGVDANPELASRIEFHNPTGKVYIARSYGRETIFGKEVEKGIAGRVLEYANELLEKAYITDPGPDLNNDGVPDWYIPRLNPETGQALVKFDPSVQHIDPATGGISASTPGCNAALNTGCTCDGNRACVELRDYVAVPHFLRETMDAYGLGRPRTRGIF